SSTVTWRRLMLTRPLALGVSAMLAPCWKASVLTISAISVRLKSILIRRPPGSGQKAGVLVSDGAAGELVARRAASPTDAPVCHTLLMEANSLRVAILAHARRGRV